MEPSLSDITHEIARKFNDTIAAVRSRKTTPDELVAIANKLTDYASALRIITEVVKEVRNTPCPGGA